MKINVKKFTKAFRSFFRKCAYAGKNKSSTMDKGKVDHVALYLFSSISKIHF